MRGRGGIIDSQHFSTRQLDWILTFIKVFCGKVVRIHKMSAKFSKADEDKLLLKLSHCFLQSSEVSG